MYLACRTQPDLAFAVNLLAWFSNNPSKEHWRAINHLIGYFQKNPRRGVKLNPGPPSVCLYVDARWGGEHKRPTTGFILQHYGNPIA
jgi:hypothetical protein